MRKKFLAMYALVGALVASPIFTSCIDSEESESVTAVRTAKAEQLKAAAALAAAQQAIQELNLAHQEKLNAIALEKEQWDLEEAKLNHEKNMLQYQKDIINAEKALLDAKAEMAKYNDGVFGDLSREYTDALTEVNSLNKTLFNKKANLAELENGLVGVQEYVVNRTEELNNNIAAYKATLEVLKQSEEIDKETIKNKLLELDGQVTAAETERVVLQGQYGNMEYTSMASADKANLATIKAAFGLYQLGTTLSTPLSFVTEDANGYLILKEADVVTYKQSGAYTSPEAAAKNIADLKAALGTEADTETTVVAEGSTTLTKYAELAAANKALADAEKAVADAGDAATQVQIDAVAAAELAVAQKKDAINEQLVLIAQAEATTNDFDEWIAAFSGEDYETYKAAVDAFNAIDVTAQIAEIEVILATYLEGIGSSSSSDPADVILNRVYGTHYCGFWDFKSNFKQNEQIATLESELELAEAELANIQATLNLPSVDNVYTDDQWTEAELEAVIALLKEEIAVLEARLEAEKNKAEIAKAALDAYLASSDDTETEAGTEEAA